MWRLHKIKTCHLLWSCRWHFDSFRPNLAASHNVLLFNRTGNEVKDVKCCWEHAQGAVNEWSGVRTGAVAKVSSRGCSITPLLLWISREQCVCCLFPWLPKPVRRLLDGEPLGTTIHPPLVAYVLVYCKTIPDSHCSSDCQGVHSTLVEL